MKNCDSLAVNIRAEAPLRAKHTKKTLGAGQTSKFEDMQMNFCIKRLNNVCYSVGGIQLTIFHSKFISQILQLQLVDFFAKI